MQKKVLSEQSLYYGEIKMPKGFEINPLNLTNNFFKALNSKTLGFPPKI